MPKRKDIKFVDQLLNSALRESATGKSKLRNLFNQKLLETRISFNQAAVNMEVDNKLLEKILDGVISQFDKLALPKIAQFLDIPVTVVADMFFSMVSERFKDELDSSKKKEFYPEHF